MEISWEFPWKLQSEGWVKDKLKLLPFQVTISIFQNWDQNIYTAVHIILNRNGHIPVFWELIDSTALWHKMKARFIFQYQNQVFAL